MAIALSQFRVALRCRRSSGRSCRNDEWKSEQRRDTDPPKRHV